VCAVRQEGVGELSSPHLDLPRLTDHDDDSNDDNDDDDEDDEDNENDEHDEDERAVDAGE